MLIKITDFLVWILVVYFQISGFLYSWSIILKKLYELSKPLVCHFETGKISIFYVRLKWDGICKALSSHRKVSKLA